MPPRGEAGCMARALQLGRYPLSASVAVPLAAMALVGALFARGSMSSDLAAVLYPAVLPWYVGVAAASGLRNTLLPALGNGLGFWTVAVAVMALEALLLGGVFEVVRAGVRGVRTRRRGTA